MHAELEPFDSQCSCNINKTFNNTQYHNLKAQCSSTPCQATTTSAPEGEGEGGSGRGDRGGAEGGGGEGRGWSPAGGVGVSDCAIGGEGEGVRQGGEGEEEGWRLAGEVGEGGAQDPVLIACDRSSKGLMGVVSLRPPGFCERAASGPCGRDWVPGPSAVSCPGASAPRWEGADADAWPSRPAAWQSWPVVLPSESHGGAAGVSQSRPVVPPS